MACHEIEEALQLKPSSIRYFAWVGGAVGTLFGLALATYAHLQWHLITSGKPVLAWIPFFVIAFECCILFGVLSTLLGLSILTRLPRFWLSDAYDSRFSQDRFWHSRFLRHERTGSPFKIAERSGSGRSEGSG